MRLTIALILLTTVAAADEKVIGHPSPLPQEVLGQPVGLSNQCSGVFIREWRGQRLTKTHVELMDDVCNLVDKHFYKFVEGLGYPAQKRAPIHYSISVIPIGEGYRELNDDRYRFNGRRKFCGKNAEGCNSDDERWTILGWTDRNEKYHFLRNDLDINNPDEYKTFQIIFAHELFHELSWESGSFWSYSDMGIEEVLAQRFTKYIGLGD